MQLTGKTSAIELTFLRWQGSLSFENHILKLPAAKSNFPVGAMNRLNESYSKYISFHSWTTILFIVSLDKASKIWQIFLAILYLCSKDAKRCKENMM